MQASNAEPTLPPGPRSFLPWIGQGARLGRDPFPFFEEVTNRYGGLASFIVAGKRFFLVSSPEAVCRVLIDNSTNYRKGPVLAHIREALGDGLLTAEGESWRLHRKRAQPAFHRNALRAQSRLISGIAKTRVATWNPGAELSLLDEMMSLTLEIAVRALFGSETQDLPNDLGSCFSEITRYFEHAISPLGQTLGKLSDVPKRKYLRAVRTWIEPSGS